MISRLFMVTVLSPDAPGSTRLETELDRTSHRSARAVAVPHPHEFISKSEEVLRSHAEE
jgi:hypothetical protein